MRKGTKRKASRKDEALKSTEGSKSVVGMNKDELTLTDGSNKETSKSAEETKTQPNKAVKRAKRARIMKPESEFFPEKRNLEDLWQQVFPVGTEWEQLDHIYQYKWNFSNLEVSFLDNAFEEGGELYGKKVYLFSTTEPQFVPFQGQRMITFIPIVVAVVSPFPPSEKIRVKSVQRETE